MTHPRGNIAELLRSSHAMVDVLRSPDEAAERAALDGGVQINFDMPVCHVCKVRCEDMKFVATGGSHVDSFNTTVCDSVTFVFRCHGEVDDHLRVDVERMKRTALTENTSAPAAKLQLAALVREAVVSYVPFSHKLDDAERATVRTEVEGALVDAELVFGEDD